MFRTLDHLPLAEQEEAYVAGLIRCQDRIWADLADIATCNPGQRLVILCWCRVDVALDGGCHRRWAARWFEDEHGLVIPEISA